MKSDGEFLFTDVNVNGQFSISENKITSLEGCPVKVNESFVCSINKELHSLKGAPIYVGKHFMCNSTGITSLDGCPKEVGGDFVCYNNKREFTIEEVRRVCNVHGSIIV